MANYGLRDMALSLAQNKPNDVAYVCGDKSITWSQLYRRSDLAGALFQQQGVGKGVSLGVLAPETIEVYEHFHACLKIGAIRVGINRRFSPKEAIHTIQDGSVKVLLVHADCMPLINEIKGTIQDNNITLIGFGGNHGLSLDYESLLQASELEIGKVELCDTDPAMYTYTSGTTGLPKGVVLSSKALQTVVELSVANFGFLPGDRFYCPLANAWAAVLFNLLGMANGMTTVIPDGEFNTAEFLQEVERQKISVFLLAPTMLQWALDEYAKSSVDISSIRMGIYGSAPAAPKLIKATIDTFNCDLVQAYGVSEAAAGWISYLSAEDHRKGLLEKPEILQSAGRAPSYFQLSVRDEDGVEVEQGEVGELWVKSDSVMTEYLNLSEQTDEVLKDGWLVTNDMAVIDTDGYIFLKDRRKFMIVTGGINVFPAGVEAIMSAHSAVHEIAVVGVPHKVWGEAVIAVVYPVPGASVESQELLSFCEGKLSKVMTPKFIYFVDQPLPKSANLKIQKHVIQSWFRENPALLPESFIE